MRHSRVLGTSIFDKYGALDKIVEIGDTAVEPLIEALRRDKDEVAQMVATEALGRIGNKQAMKVLIETSKSRVHPDVRWHVAEALRETGHERDSR